MDKGIKALKSVAGCFNGCGLGVCVYEEDGRECGLEVEGWTPGGVNMIHFLDFRQDGNILDPWDIADKVNNLYNEFDIDEEIDAHRQDNGYRSAFTHKRSVTDFEEWKETLFRLNADIGNVIMSINNYLTEFDFEDLGVTAKEIFENGN